MINLTIRMYLDTFLTNERDIIFLHQVLYKYITYGSLCLILILFSVTSPSPEIKEKTRSVPLSWGSET